MLAFFSISPLGAGESVGAAVADVIALIESSGLDYQVTAMGTLIEGDPDRLFDLLKRCHAEMKKRHNRVTSKILIDDRGREGGHLQSKIASLEKHLGHRLTP